MLLCGARADVSSTYEAKSTRSISPSFWMSGTSAVRLGAAWVGCAWLKVAACASVESTTPLVALSANKNDRVTMVATRRRIIGGLRRLIRTVSCTCVNAVVTNIRQLTCQMSGYLAHRTSRRTGTPLIRTSTAYDPDGADERSAVSCGAPPRMWVTRQPSIAYTLSAEISR